MNTKLLPFEKREISITLTGEEWFAMIAKLTAKDLSPKGRALNKSAGEKMAKQLSVESGRK